MAKNLIGKRVRVVLGDEPPTDDPDTIIGQDTTVHVPSSEIHKYDKIVGEEVSLTIGGIEEDLIRIINTIQNTKEPNKDRIVQVSKEIINEPDKSKKLEKVNLLLSLAKGITSITSSIIDIKTKLGL